jgi:protein-disulfide isomerase
MSSESVRPLRRERRAAALAERRARRRHPSRRRLGIGTISVFALIGGFALVAALMVLNRPAAGPPAATVLTARAPIGIPAAGTVLGRADAPVTIDLYEDFQCPACRRWSEAVFPQLVSHELATGTVRIAFHGFAFLGPESTAAGRAAWAAERQGRFWDLWATLYANQGLHENAGAFDRERLLAMADAVGLDRARFAADFDDPAAARAVATDAAAAAAAGVDSTPTVLVNGAPVGGTYPELSAAIAAAAGS